MVNHQWRVALRAPGSCVWDPRYRMLDLWRGLACLLVVAHHAGHALEWSEAEGTGAAAWSRWLTVLAFRKMNLGVSLFFVISGYCIAASARSAAGKGGSPWSFMSRRFWRIYPPYWAAVLVFVAIVAGLEAAGLGRLYHGSLPGLELDAPRALDWRQWLGNLTLTETWRPHFWGPSRNVYTTVAWSLCFEEQFYLICFLALLTAPRRFYTVIGGVTLATTAVRVWFWQAGALSTLRGTFPMAWHEFAVGMAVFYRLNVATRVLEKRLIELGLVALTLVGICTRGECTVTSAAFGLLLVALRPLDERWAGHARLAPFVASGRRCYSIYLAHLPFVIVGSRWLHEVGLSGFWERALVVAPLVSVAGVAAGWAFHAVVEVRFVNPPLTPRPVSHAPQTHSGPWRRISARSRPTRTVAT